MQCCSLTLPGLEQITSASLQSLHVIADIIHMTCAARCDASQVSAPALAALHSFNLSL